MSIQLLSKLIIGVGGQSKFTKLAHHSPKLNMAIPSPASESMEIDFASIFGIARCHLGQKRQINQMIEKFK